MPKKSTQPKEYQKIPVSPDVYAQVRLIADLNDRGMGDQVAAWVKRDLPQCEHELQGVDIEYEPTADTLGASVRVGWFCATCNRVYVASPISVEIGQEEDAVASTGSASL